jgi:undecaprenyl pyrophosphate phosphatase UppP
MGYYRPQEPQRQEPSDPYKTNNPYDSQSYTSSQNQQQTYFSGAGSTQEKVQSGKNESFFAQLWRVLSQYLGLRGVVAAVGAVVALLAFFTMPYYSLYSGHFLAAQTYDDKWWLELVLAAVPLAIVILRPIVSRMQQHGERWALVILGSGVLGVLIHFWFMNMVISSNYWRFGTWSYFIGMALVALAGLLSLIPLKR